MKNMIYRVVPLLFSGSTNIMLLSISTITMMYLFPCCDLVGNPPVWSKKIMFLTSYTLWCTHLRLFFLLIVTHLFLWIPNWYRLRWSPAGTSFLSLDLTYNIRCSGGLRFLLLSTLGSATGGLCRSDILPCLINVSFWSFKSLWVINTL